jgi:competence protein ComEA
MISFLLLVLRLVYPYLVKPDPIIIKDLPTVLEELDSAETKNSRHYAATYPQKEKENKLFVFDPNKVNEEQLLQLGFREKNAGIFLRFREKGFVFRKKEDLKKVYGISESFYERLEPYILIESREQAEDKLIEKPASAPTQENSSGPVRKAITKVDLNNADSSSLVELPGIGQAYTRRILKYRELLGGFVSAEQLKEVYGMNDELFQKISPYVFVGKISPRQLDLNADNFKTINRHPYLTYEITKNIFDWRRKTTITTTNLRDILSDESLYAKILPYLSLTP